MTLKAKHTLSNRIEILFYVLLKTDVHDPTDPAEL